MALFKWAGIGMIAIAILLGGMAIRSLSQGTEASTREPAVSRSVLVARRELPSGTVLGDRDVAISIESGLNEDALTQVSAVAGRTLATDLAEGAVLREGHLTPLGVLARALRDGETAVAVEVDGVTGLGGFVKPGDTVDVLFLLRRDGREIKHTQARTLLVNARVLAFGTKLEDGRSDEPTLNARTAVLAVSEQDAPTLLLADVVGTLRLALRQSDGKRSRTRYPSASLEELLRGETRERDSTHPIQIIRGDRPHQRKGS